MTGIQELNSISALDEALAQKSALFILKHSTRCETSAEADAQFRRFAADVDPTRVRLARVLVIEHREVSRALAERTQVRHESPQAFRFEDGRLLWHADHWEITRESLQAALAVSPGEGS